MKLIDKVKEEFEKNGMNINAVNYFIEIASDAYELGYPLIAKYEMEEAIVFLMGCREHKAAEKLRECMELFIEQ